MRGGVYHVLKTIFFLMGHVLNVFLWMCVHSTTQMRFTVWTTTQIYRFVMMMLLTVLTIIVLTRTVFMGMLVLEGRNVNLEGWGVEGVNV